MENQSQLTVVDLANIHQLIDAAAQRGAFRAGEMQQVGEIYNKLTTFLNSIAAQQKEAQQSEGGTAETTSETQGEENA